MAANTEYCVYLTKNVREAYRFSKAQVLHTFNVLEIQAYKNAKDPRELIPQKVGDDRFLLRLKNGKNVRFLGLEQVGEFVPEQPIF